MKKFLALILAGVMVASMGVIALAAYTPEQIDEIMSSGGELSPAPTDEEWAAYTAWMEDKSQQEENNQPSVDWVLIYAVMDGTASVDDLNEEEMALYNNLLASYGISSSSSSSGGGEVVYDRASEAEALAIQATGIPMETTLAAAEENKSVGEYMNNAVVAAPGLSNAVPVSQGGNVIINGQPSNQTFSVLKVLSGHTDAAKAQAAAIGGRVLNVARIDASVYFDTATVNFYMPGVATGQNIQVYQYDYANGQWLSVNVAEVRDDHVVVDMTSLGVLAFFEVPTAE